MIKISIPSKIVPIGLKPGIFFQERGMAKFEENDLKDTTSADQDLINDLDLDIDDTDLEEYGVWVKSGPEDVEMQQWEENFELSDLSDTDTPEGLTDEEEKLLSNLEEELEESDTIFETSEDTEDFTLDFQEEESDPLSDFSSFEDNGLTAEAGLPDEEDILDKSPETDIEDHEKDTEDFSTDLENLSDEIEALDDNIESLDASFFESDKIESLTVGSESADSGTAERNEGEAEESPAFVDLHDPSFSENSSDFTDISLDDFTEFTGFTDDLDTGEEEEDEGYDEDFLDLDIDLDADEETDEDESDDLFVAEEVDDFFGIPVEDFSDDSSVNEEQAAPSDLSSESPDDDKNFFTVEDDAVTVSADSSNNEPDNEDFTDFSSFDDLEMDETFLPSADDELSSVSLDDIASSDEDLPELEVETSSAHSEETSDAPYEADLSDVEILEDNLFEESPAETSALDLVSDEINSIDEKVKRARQGESFESSILLKIEQELASIKSELSTLKSEISSLKIGTHKPSIGDISDEPKLEESVSGFFDDDEDETIALTGDELDNILNTADITEESGDTLETEPDVQDVFTEINSDEALLTQNDDLIPLSDSHEEEPVLSSEPADNIIDEAGELSAVEQFDETPSFDEVSDDYNDDLYDVLSESDAQEDISVSDSDIPEFEEIDIEGLSASADEDEDDEEISQLSDLSEDFHDDLSDTIEEDSSEISEASADLISEDFDETGDDPDADFITTETSDALEDFIDSGLTEENEFDSALSALTADYDQSEDDDLVTDEIFEDSESLPLESENFEDPESLSVEDENFTENESLIEDYETLEDNAEDEEEIFEEFEGTEAISFENEVYEETQPEEEQNFSNEDFSSDESSEEFVSSEDENDVGEASEFDDFISVNDERSSPGESPVIDNSLKSEIRSVLGYMDTLLEALPEDENSGVRTIRIFRCLQEAI